MHDTPGVAVRQDRSTQKVSLASVTGLIITFVNILCARTSRAREVRPSMMRGMIMNSRLLLPTLVLSASLVGCTTNRPISLAGIEEGMAAYCEAEQHLPVSDRNAQATQKLTALQSRLPEWLGQSTVPSAGVSLVADSATRGQGPNQ